MFVVLALAAPLAASAAPRIEAQLSAGTLEAGDNLTLVVSVSDAAGDIGDPVFTLPKGLSQLGSERSSQFSFVNGRATSRTEFHYAIGADAPGRYGIGPIRVRIGGRDYSWPAMTVVVKPATARPQATPGATRDARGVGASLVVDARPARPYAGQLVQLRLMLVQTRDVTGGGPQALPSTAGFWSEAYGEPVVSRGTSGGRSAVVTERRARIYALAPGRAVIGPASIIVAPVGSADPFMGGAPARPVELVSDSVRVDVRPLPGGAPAEFENAVGRFEVSAALDRGHITQDQGLTLRLDVRGTGNLPLLRTPQLAEPDFDVFAGAVDDSFAPAGEIAPGRRRFQWTLSAKHAGRLVVTPPPVAWFDPEAGQYRRVELPALVVDVLAAGPGGRRNEDADVLPGALAREAPAPGRRGAWPWAFALAGLAAGAAVRLWRRGGAPDPGDSERIRARALMAAVDGTRGADFWRAAEEAGAWLAGRGVRVAGLDADIAAARYSGRAVAEDGVRAELGRHLAAAMPPARSRAHLRVAAAGLLAVGVLGAVAGFGGPGSSALDGRVRRGDAFARDGQVAEAASAWASVWREAPGDRALAARLAWAALRGDRMPEAGAWLLRARGGEARSGAWHWAEARVREAGGLTGAPGEGPPLRSIEWAALAFALALALALEWPRRATSVVLALLVLGVALGVPLARRAASGDALAVVVRECPLGGEEAALQPGQVVRVLAARADSTRVSAGRDLVGPVATDALVRVGEAR